MYVSRKTLPLGVVLEEIKEETIVRGTKQGANLVCRSIVQKYLLIFSRRPRQLGCRYSSTLIKIVKKKEGKKRRMIRKEQARDKKCNFLYVLASVKIEDDPIVSSHRIMSPAIEMEGADLCAKRNTNKIFLCVFSILSL
jgi:hypothetical protein